MNLIRRFSMSASHLMELPKPSPVVGKPFSISLIQLGGIGADKEANVSHALAMIDKAQTERRSDIIVLPEIFNSPYATNMFRKYAENIGYVPGRKYDVESSQSATVKALSGAAKKAGAWLIGGSIPEIDDGKVYNSSPVFNPSGELVALHRKVHLFDIDIPGKIRFVESETLTGGDRLTLVETDYGKIGIGICYDVRFPELAMIAARQGAIAMVYPAAFNTTTGPLHWDLLQRARAVDNQIYVAMCSPARALEGDGYKAYGFSSVYDPLGHLVGQLDEKEDILYASINTAKIDEARSGIPVTVQRRFDLYADVSKA